MSDPVDTDRSPDVPVWEDTYVDQVSDRLMFNYDLEKDRSVRGERFVMYGRMQVVNRKSFLHPALSYARHEAVEHLFVRRADRVTVTDLERLVDLGHALADDWIEPDEDHYGTDFTFVVLAGSIPDDVREFVAGFRDRTLIRYGYHGQYEIHLAVVAPDRETSVASEATDIEAAFELWEPIDEEESGGLLGRLFG
jgi:hypothetical protein